MKVIVERKCAVSFRHIPYTQLCSIWTFQQHSWFNWKLNYRILPFVFEKFCFEVLYEWF